MKAYPTQKVFNTSSMDVAAFFVYVNTIGIPIIVVVGVVGNTISFVVFVTTHLRVPGIPLKTCLNTNGIK